jgi:hypothetical protein
MLICIKKNEAFFVLSGRLPVAKMFARTIHPTYAIWIFDVVFIFLILCLTNSSYFMFGHSFNPTCMDGTTTTPYSGDSAPNAPDSNSRPFCTSATADSFPSFFISYGFFGVANEEFDSFARVGRSTFRPYRRLGENSSCPSFADENADSFTVTVQADTFSVTDSPQTTNLLNAVSGLAAITGFNNLPFQLTGATTTYYLRAAPVPPSPVGPTLPTFRVARTTRDPPLDEAAMRATFGEIGRATTIRYISISQCASQFRSTFRPGPGTSHINADGTLKTSNGGPCLVQATQTAAQVSIPGLIGTAITLQLVLIIIMSIAALRKQSWFNILFVSINVLTMIMMIAAVALGAAVLAGLVAPCLFLTDFSSDQVAPSPTRAAVNGFTPSLGGVSPQSQGPQTFQAVQSGNSAVFMRPAFFLHSGAIFGIVFIVLHFIFTIFFGIKTDWAEAAEKGSSLVSVQMTPT